MKTRAGASAIVSIMILFLIAVAGGGGFLTYKYMTEPDFDFYGLPVYDVAPFLRRVPSFVPSELVSFVPGANADGVFVFQKSEGISPWLNMMDTLINELEPTNDSDAGAQSSLNDVEAVLGAYKSPQGTGDYPNGSGVLALRFNSPEKAGALNEFISQYILLLPIRTSLSEDILVFEMDSQGLSGNILDCPLWKKVDQKRAESNAVFLANVRESEELALVGNLLINMIPAGDFEGDLGGGIGSGDVMGGLEDDFGGIFSLAVSASDSPLSLFRQNLGVMMMFAEFNSVYLNIEDGLGEIDFVTDFVEEDEVLALLAERNLSGAVVDGSGGGGEELLNDTELFEMYREGLKELKSSVPEVIDYVNNSEFDGTADIELNERNLQIVITSPVSEDNISSLEDSRDNQRKIDLKAIIASLESYKLQNGAYPAESSCVDLIEGLEESFMTLSAPVDPLGLREFNFGGNGGDGYAVGVTGDNVSKSNRVARVVGETKLNEEETIFASSEESVDSENTGDDFVACTGGYYYQYFGRGNYGVWAKMENIANGNTDGSLAGIKDYADVMAGSEGQYFFVYKGE